MITVNGTRTVQLFLLAILVSFSPYAYAQSKAAHTESIEEVRARAQKGEGDAEFNLGFAYAYGQGVRQDYAEAAKWYRKAADAGIAEAQFNLGLAYANGQGLKQDYREAAKWYRKAADAGIPSAQINLGHAYYAGEGVPQDYAEAAKWHRKAAEAGEADAQYDLGHAYYTGQGVPQDYAEAAKWYRKAAEAGEADAQFALGLMYISCQGGPCEPTLMNGVTSRLTYANEMEAFKWFDLAAGGRNASMLQRSGKQNKYAAMRDELALRYSWTPQSQMNSLKSSPSPTLPPAQSGAQALNGLGTADKTSTIPMLQEGGVYVVPVVINNSITLNFVVDSGAADVSIPADVVTTLMRTGTIRQSDFIGTRTYTLADGSTTTSPTFRISSLRVGDIVLQNVMGSVANANGDLLLGQSFLGRFKSWSIDNTRHALVLQ